MLCQICGKAPATHGKFCLNCYPIFNKNTRIPAALKNMLTSKSSSERTSACKKIHQLYASKVQIIRLCTNDFISKEHLSNVLMAKALPEACALNPNKERRKLIISISYNAPFLGPEMNNVEEMNKVVKTICREINTSRQCSTYVSSLPIQDYRGKIPLRINKGKIVELVDYAAIRNSQYKDCHLINLLKNHIGPLAIQHCDYDIESGQLYYGKRQLFPDKNVKKEKGKWCHIKWEYGKWPYINYFMNPLVSFGMYPARRYLQPEFLIKKCEERLDVMEEHYSKKQKLTDKRLRNTNYSLCKKIANDKEYAKGIIDSYERNVKNALKNRSNKESRWGVYPSEPGLLQSRELFMIGVKDQRVRFQNDTKLSKEGMGLLQNALAYYRSLQMKSYRISKSTKQMENYEKAISPHGYVSYDTVKQNINKQLPPLNEKQIEYSKTFYNNLKLSLNNKQKSGVTWNSLRGIIDKGLNKWKNKTFKKDKFLEKTEKDFITNAAIFLKDFKNLKAKLNLNVSDKKPVSWKQACEAVKQLKTKPQERKRLLREAKKYFINSVDTILENVETQLKNIKDNLATEVNGHFYKFRMNLNMMGVKGYSPVPIELKENEKQSVFDHNLALDEAYRQTNALNMNYRSIHFQSSKYSYQDMGDWFYEDIRLQTKRSGSKYKTEPTTFKKNPEKKVAKCPSRPTGYMGKSDKTRIPPLVVFNVPLCKDGLKPQEKGPFNLLTQTYFNLEEDAKVKNEPKAENLFRRRGERMASKIRSRSPSPGPRSRMTFKSRTREEDIIISGEGIKKFTDQQLPNQRKPQSSSSDHASKLIGKVPPPEPVSKRKFKSQ